VAVLMVSRIRYSHILNQYIKGKKPFAHLIRALLFLGLIIWSRQAALVIIFCGFAASGLVKWFYYKVIFRKDHLAIHSPLIAVDGVNAAQQDDT
jgi:phosphatidylserine synthase